MSTPTSTASEFGVRWTTSDGRSWTAAHPSLEEAQRCVTEFRAWQDLRRLRSLAVCAVTRPVGTSETWAEVAS